MNCLPLFATAILLLPICCDAGTAQEGCPAANVNAQLKQYMDRYEFERPGRSDVNQSLPWRFGAPNYDAADLLYFKGRTKNHAAGSAEHMVENLGGVAPAFQGLEYGVPGAVCYLGERGAADARSGGGRHGEL